MWTGSEAAIAAVDASGRLLVMLHTNPGGQGATDTYVLQRRAPAPTVDTTFGNQGSVSLTGTPVNLAVAPNGNIIVVLQGQSSGVDLLALDSNGAPLSGFDATAAVTAKGLTVVAQTPWQGAGYDFTTPKQTTVTFQPDNDLVVLASNAYDQTIVTRLGQTGGVDPSFGDAGYLTIAGTFGWDVAVLPSGDLVVVTQASSGSNGILGAWYSSTGVGLGASVSIYENSYGGLLHRSNGAVLLGTAVGSTVTFAVYSGLGAADAGASIALPWQDHCFIGAQDAITYLSGVGPGVTVNAELPDGTSLPANVSTVTAPAGDSVRFLNAIADGAGGVFLLGDTCGATNCQTETISCSSLIAHLSASGTLEQ